MFLLWLARPYLHYIFLQSQRAPCKYYDKLHSRYLYGKIFLIYNYIHTKRMPARKRSSVGNTSCLTCLEISGNTLSFTGATIEIIQCGMDIGQACAIVKTIYMFLFSLVQSKSKDWFGPKLTLNLPSNHHTQKCFQSTGLVWVWKWANSLSMKTE